MEALIVIALLWVVWLISPRRWRRRLVQPVIALVVISLIVTSPIMVAAATWGLTVALPTDTGERADAIVVLGRGESLRDQRFDLAMNLWKANRAPRIFISGMLDARTMVQFLKDSGVPGEVVGGEECSQSTEENAQFTTAILHPQGIRKILLVTDTPHMLRSFLMFQSFGFTVVPYPNPLPSTWNSRQKVYVLCREYLALASYALGDRFRSRTPEEIATPPADVSAKMLDWDCQVQGT